MTYVQPVFAFLLTLASFAAFRFGMHKGRKRLLAAAMTALFFFSWMPVAMLLMRAAQSPYSRFPLATADAEAIVVLSGLVQDPFPPLPVPVPGSNTYERCLYAAWLHKRWPLLPIVASGGGNLTAERSADSDIMQEILLSQGVPGEMIWTENRSGSTYENAVQSAKLLREKGIQKILLVTDALHMNRAEKCFRKQGLTVIPAPCGFRRVYDFELRDLLPSWRSILWNEEVIHEYVGLVWYWILGRI